MIPATVRDAAELQELFERFISLSERAIVACATGDDVALATTLDARDIVASRASELTRAFDLARRVATTTAARDVLDQSLRPVRVAATTAQRLNDDLANHAQSLRTTLGEQLDRLRHDESARSAYAEAALRGERTFLDVTR